jgi:ABC-type sugar transport system substrate-binding protein
MQRTPEPARAVLALAGMGEPRLPWVESAAARPTIVISLAEKDTAFQKLQAEDARAAGRRLDLDVQIYYAHDNPHLQTQQLLRALRGESRPAALVIEPLEAQGLETLVRRAAECRIASAVLGDVGYVEALRAEFPGVAIFRVVSDPGFRRPGAGPAVEQLASWMKGGVVPATFTLGVRRRPA